MKIIIIYLIAGVIFNIIGPLTKVIKREVLKLEIISIPDIIRNDKPIPKWKVILFEITLRLLILFFYPLLFLFLKIDLHRQSSSEESWEFTNSLCDYIGCVAIKCNDCGWKNSVTSDLHGLASDYKTLSYDRGYQCQKCGKFIIISNRPIDIEIDKCECGGYYSREKPLFCPKCKSKNVTAKTLFMT